MEVSIKAGLSIMAVCMTLTGCAEIVDPTVGKGPITLGQDARQAFVEYQTKQTPRYFAVSSDGQAYFYSYCDVGRCLRQPKTTVIQRCETFSDGLPCRIYASHGNVVWRDDG